MNILVTGGAGFIGSHIVDKYVELGHNVTIIDDLSSGKIEYINKKTDFFNVDVCDYEKLKKIFKIKNFDVINHHAAKINVVESISNPKLNFEVNVLGTLNLLNLAKEFKIKRFIFASSGGAIKFNNKKEFYSIYGLNKYISELYLINFYRYYKIEYVSLRYSNVYGPRQLKSDYSGVISIFCRNFLNNEDFIIYGNGNQTRDFVYISDVIEANILALNSKIGIYNIASGIETSILELVNVFEKLLGKKINIKFYPKREVDIDRSFLIINKTINILKWKPKISLEEGIKETLKWIKSQL